MKTALLLFWLFPLFIAAQDITGTWEGRESGSSYVKLVIAQIKDSCYGYTYDEGPGFCRANFAGRFDRDNQKLRGRGISFIARSPGHILGVYNLSYSKEGADEYLEGTVGAKGIGSLIFAGGPIQLKKISRQVDTTRFMLERTLAFKNNDKPDSLKAGTAKAAPRVTLQKDTSTRTNKFSPDTITYARQQRESKTIKTIYTNVDTVKLMLYDNGVVDGDTVTVFLDNAILLNSYGISEKGKELLIPLTKDRRAHTVELFANNLGTIPPNTALIVIMAGSERYEVFASYDLSSNAKIIFQYKE